MRARRPRYDRHPPGQPINTNVEEAAKCQSEDEESDCDEINFRRQIDSTHLGFVEFLRFVKSARNYKSESLPGRTDFEHPELILGVFKPQQVALQHRQIGNHLRDHPLPIEFFAVHKAQLGCRRLAILIRRSNPHGVAGYLF
jgi:hypothetical protein